MNEIIFIPNVSEADTDSLIFNVRVDALLLRTVKIQTKHFPRDKHISQSHITICVNINIGSHSLLTH